MPLLESLSNPHNAQGRERRGSRTRLDKKIATGEANTLGSLRAGQHLFVDRLMMLGLQDVAFGPHEL